MTTYVIQIEDEDLKWLGDHLESIMMGPDGRPGHASPVGMHAVGAARAVNNAREVQLDAGATRTYTETS